MSSNKIVVVTGEMDTHADYILTQLKSRGHETYRLHPADVPTAASVRVRYDGEKFGGAFIGRKNVLALDEIKSIWWRRPEPMVDIPDLSKQESDFAKDEVRKALHGLWAIVDCYWMSHPRRIMDAENKLHQLKRATRLGLSIPRTIVTSDPAEVSAFFEECGGKMIYKVLCQPSLKTPIEEPARSIFTTVITREFLCENLHKVMHTPCLFQEYVEKAYELRVTVIGDEVFTAAIDSQSQERTKWDWRHYDVPMLLRKETLPAEIEARCVKLVKSYGLNFGAIDLIVTPDGQHVFLEINPNGQWLFIESRVPELKMTDALINCLATGEPEPAPLFETS